MAMGIKNKSALRKKAVFFVISAILESIPAPISSISQGIPAPLNLDLLKREACRKFGLKESFKNSEILAHFPKEKLNDEIRLLLKRKPMRTASGVAPIAVMVKPQGSCKWACIYCPYTGKAPKSYTGYEPAAMRAQDNDFVSIRQVRSRLAQYKANGHDSSKCDIIVMGGTFLSMPKKYKNDFIKGIYDGLNGCASSSLEKAKSLNEGAPHRAVGLTIETRPDVCGQKEIREMLSYGATKVELGVQFPSDKIYRLINRGHTVRDVSVATRRLKDSALKVAYHIMLGLPGSSPEKDVEMFKKLFSDPRFKPDMLKIYPTLVIPNTKLHKLMLAGKYAPYTTEQATEVLSKAYMHIPPYVRVMRIQRDIPVNLAAAGVDKSNLRELVERRLESAGKTINDIRYREAGLSHRKVGETRMVRINYGASGGKECFISLEDKTSGALAGFVRLRIPSATQIQPEIDKGTALVRELHIFGEETPLGETGQVQHRGFGSRLLQEAEKIAAEEYECGKMAIISAVGVKQYYYKKGYSPDGPYVSKLL